jgi:hypothetical protein
MSIEAIRNTTSFAESADLFTGRERGRNVGYQHFASLAAAVTYCVEKLSPVQLSAAVIEVGDDRYAGRDIGSLYAQPDFPRELPAAR